MKAAWEKIETGQPPQRIRKIVEIDWDTFSDGVLSGAIAEELTTSLYAGDAWLMRGAFSPEWMAELKRKTVEWTRSRPESFHKMLGGAPDFHRMIDIETGKKYAVEACKHSAYFFRWNDDPLRIWEDVTDRWAILKLAMGLEADEYESNLPSDGPVDRIQVVRYPPKIGFLEPHQDAHQNQRCFISGYMGKRGVDFNGGGFYFIGENDEVIDAESMINVGDLCIGYATVMHGVAPCDRDKEPDWDKDDGRWFLGLYSNSPDYGERVTVKPVKLNIPGVLP
jgi:hypothetical protein